MPALGQNMAGEKRNEISRYQKARPMLRSCPIPCIAWVAALSAGEVYVYVYVVIDRFRMLKKLFVASNLNVLPLGFGVNIDSKQLQDVEILTGIRQSHFQDRYIHKHSR